MFFMKKTISALLICIILVLLTSCGNKLTVDNCKDYLDVNAHIQGDVIYDKYCLGADGIVKVESISDLYDYSKISLVVTVCIDTEYDEEINKENLSTGKNYVDVPINLNAAGNGEASFRIDFPSYFEAVDDKTMTPLAKENPGQYSKYYPTITAGVCTIKSIKGSLKK